MLLSFLKRNWFLLGILAALLCGFLSPRLGTKLNPASVTTTTIVVVLFLISGLTLPSETIKTGMRDIKLHAYIQLFVFIATPLFFFFSTQFLRGHIDPGILVGMLALGCLPTTISSCVIFTQISEGNVTGTMFNASLVNILGIVLSLLLLSFFLQGAGQALPVGAITRILASVCLKMLLPIAIGQALRLLLRQWASAHRKTLSVVSSALILVIVFFAISKSAGNPMFAGNLTKLVLPILYLALAHVVLVLGAYGGARLLRFSQENMISVLYAAPQKTLSMGIPLLSTYFAYDTEMLAVAILPLLFYHPWQLMVAGFIRNTYNKRRDGSGPATRPDP